MLLAGGHNVADLVQGVAVKDQPGLLLVDDKADDRALMEVILLQTLPAIRLLAPAEPVALGQLLASETCQAAIIDADLQWCNAFDLVRQLKSANPACLVIFYSKTGIQTLTPEIAGLGLTAFYSKSPGELLQIPKAIAEGVARLSTIPAKVQDDIMAPPAEQPEHEVSDAGFRSEMFYAISHDLKQPLQIFARQTRFLQTHYSDRLDAAGQSLVENMGQVSAHMEMLLDSILNYYRLDVADSGEENAAVGEVIGSVLAMLQSRLDEVSGTVLIGKLPAVQVNKGRMAQLFQNLLDNAIKFRGPDPLVIEISALDVTDNWLFTVKDNGIGIDSDQPDQVFAMFKRLHSQSEYPGSGVGLALCKRIIEQQGGKIWVRAGSGEGTAIHFTLPKNNNPLQARRSNARRPHNEASNQGTADRG